MDKEILNLNQFFIQENELCVWILFVFFDPLILTISDRLHVIECLINLDSNLFKHLNIKLKNRN
jgi:hypothetical protein